MATMRVVYQPGAGAGAVLSPLSNNRQADTRSANRRRRNKANQNRDRDTQGQRHGRRAGSGVNGPAHTGKRRANQNGNRYRQCGVHATSVEQLSLMLPLSLSLSVAPAAAPPSFQGFVLTGDAIYDDDDDDEGCEVDEYTERIRGQQDGQRMTAEIPGQEEELLQAMLSQTYETTDSILEEHATRHRECILQRWRAQQQHTAQTHTQADIPQVEQQHNAQTHTQADTPQLELIDEIDDTEDAVDQLSPTTGSRSNQSGSQSPVADAPDSPADEQSAIDNTLLAEELKEQGHALMAAGDYLNAGGTFGIARRLNPADAELRELEATADRMAESAAVELLQRPATKRCSQYSRMYDAWLSSGRPEMDSSVSMAVC